MNLPVGTSIRPYTPSDQTAVEQCTIELQDFERSLEPDRLPGAAVAQRYVQELVETCQKKQGQIFVAEIERIVGCVCIWMEMEADHMLTSLSHYAYISDLVVLPAYRHRGIGRALLEEAEAFAQQRQATAIKIGVLARNSAAHSLYQKTGFRDYEISLIKALR